MRKDIDLTPKCLNQILWSVVYFAAGGLVMILSSVTWINFTQVYKHTNEYNITVGEIIATSGQTLGQMGFIYAFILLCRVLHKYVGILKAGIIIAEFMLWLGVYDLIDTFIMVPFEVSIPKFLAFVFATLITTARLIWYKNYGRDRG